MKKILFLDFDGVLHPEDVRLVQGKIILMPDGHNLFEHADLLVELLEPHPEVKIVLSTSWVYKKGFDYAKARLPEALQHKIIGSTYHSSMREWWVMRTRFEQINGYLRRHQINDWIALDDDDVGWPDEQRHRLVKCGEYGGLGEAYDDFLEKIELLK